MLLNPRPLKAEIKASLILPSHPQFRGPHATYLKWASLMTQVPRQLPWVPLQATHPLSKAVYGTGPHLVQQSYENERMENQELPLTTNCIIFSGKRGLSGHGREKICKGEEGREFLKYVLAYLMLYILSIVT